MAPRLAAVCCALALAGEASRAGATGTPGGAPRAESPAHWSFEVSGGILRSAPEARVREFDIRGSYLDLDDGPGLAPFGAAGGIRISRRFGAWRAGVGLSLSRSDGDGSSGGGFSFNGGVFPENRTVHARLVTTRIMAEASRRVAGRENKLEVRALAAFEHYHPILTLEADPPIAIHDRREDYLQFLPLPLIGFEIRAPIRPGWDASLGARAGIAPDWGTGRSEGGPMRMSLTLAEVDAQVRRPVSRSFRIALGYAFRYAEGTLTSAEDGNWIRSREHGLAFGLEWVR